MVDVRLGWMNVLSLMVTVLPQVVLIVVVVVSNYDSVFGKEIGFCVNIYGIIN